MLRVSGLIENARNKNSQIADAYNRLLYFVKGYFENRISVNIIFDVDVATDPENSIFVDFKKYKITQLSAPSQTQNIFNSINDLNLNLDLLTTTFKKIEEYNDENLSEVFKKSTRFPSKTTYEFRDKIRKEGIRKSISILNPLIKTKFVREFGYNTLSLKLYENVNANILIKEIIKLTKDWELLPQNAKDLLNKDIDKVYNDIFSSNIS